MTIEFIKNLIGQLDNSIEYLESLREQLFVELDKELEKNGKTNSENNDI